MCTMKIVAKLINFKQIQSSKNNNSTQKCSLHKNKLFEKWEQQFLFVFYRVYCEYAFLKNYIIVYYLLLRLNL